MERVREGEHTSKQKAGEDGGARCAEKDGC